MARSSSPERLTELAGAATRVFGRLGYRRTRTSDVAAEAGMSTGALFTYVRSKEALFHLVFAVGFGEYTEGIPPLPLDAPAPGVTVGLIERGLRGSPAPRIRAALHEQAPDDVRAELTGIVEERYLGIERLWPLLAVIERSAVDLPELGAFYYRRARTTYLGQLARYLDDRIAAGYLRPVPDTAVAARIVTETIAWFAWHRKEGPDSALYDDRASRLTVVDFVCAALLESR